MADNDRQEIETDEKSIAEGRSFVRLWLDKIERAKKDEENWRKDAYEAVGVYEADDEQDISFNILHSNVETIAPASYNSTPVADVRVRFGDPDPVSKHVVDMSERGISYSLDQYDFDAEMDAIVRDALVPGRGVARIRYKPSQDGVSEVFFERWPWDKFCHGPARSWGKVPWVAFEHDMTRDQLVAINPELGAKIDLTDGGKSEEDKGKRDADQAAKGLMKTARVYEIWEKHRRAVHYIVECHPDAPLQSIDDPLGLPGFFPALKPLQQVKRISGLKPVCPHKVLKPLIEELDVITKRISKLVRTLKVRGITDSELSVDFDLLRSADDGMYLPAQNATKFAGTAQGLDKAVWSWPLDPTVKALQQLYVQRDQIKSTIYEVSGISDIVRGSSNANETATAQKIKTQWGSLRVQNLQKEVAKVSRDVFRAKVAIMAGKFSDQQMQMMTNLPQTQEQQQAWPQVMQTFRSGLRSFKIDIETDSTVRADLTRNQEQMSQFVTATGQYAQAMAGAAQQFGVAVLPVMTEIYTAMARNYKLGKQAEDALASLSQIAQKAAQQPQEEQPDPAVEKARLEMQTMQAKTQLEAQSLQAKAQHDQQMAALETQKMQLEIQIKQVELQIKQQSAQIDMQSKVMDAELRSRERQEAAQFGQQSNALKLDAMKQQAAMKSKPHNGARDGNV